MEKLKELKKKLNLQLVDMRIWSNEKELTFTKEIKRDYIMYSFNITKNWN